MRLCTQQVHQQLDMPKPQRSRVSCLATAMAILFASMVVIHPALALSDSHSNQLWMHSETTVDTGSGIASLNFNSPYHSVREVLSSAKPSSRIPFNLLPYVPSTATVNTFTWSLATAPSSFPSWLGYVSGWVESSEFTLTFNATSLLQTGIDPAPFIIRFQGNVQYSHGPTRFVEQESRVLNLVVHLHLQQTTAQRNAQLSSFDVGSVGIGGVVPYTTSSPSQSVPALTAESNEAFNFVCGGSESDLTSGCSLGRGADPVYFNPNSMLEVFSGVLNVKGPVAMWGTTRVRPGAVLVLDGEADTTVFSIMSDSLMPTIQNDGLIIVKRGILRLIGTPMIGNGLVKVRFGGTFEHDPRQESTFGPSSSSGSNGCVAIYNEGNLNIISGRTRFRCSIISIGQGIVNVGMSGVLELDGTSMHVFGGYFNGTSVVPELPGVNAVGAVVSSTVSVLGGSTLYVGGGLVVQGLGTIDLTPNANLRVRIEWYNPTSKPDALLIATGPPSERVIPGIRNLGGKISLEMGGMRLGTGIFSTGSIRVMQGSVMQLNSSSALNEIGGSGLINDGSLHLLGGASVDFRGPLLQVSGRFMAHSEASRVIFSAPSPSVVMHNAVTDSIASEGLAHVFGFFNPGELIVRPQARVLFGSIPSAPNTQESTQPARFYTGLIKNAGGIQLYYGTPFETRIFYQGDLNATDLLPRSSMALSDFSVTPSSALPDKTTEKLRSVTEMFTVYMDPQATVRMVPSTRYALGEGGSIAQADIPAEWSTSIPDGAVNEGKVGLYSDYFANIGEGVASSAFHLQSGLLIPTVSMIVMLLTALLQHSM